MSSCGFSRLSRSHVLDVLHIFIYSYAGWADHCAKHHPQHSKVNGEAHADDGDKDDDGVARSKLQSKAKAAAKKKPQPKAKAATKKTGCLKKGS